MTTYLSRSCTKCPHIYRLDTLWGWRKSLRGWLPVISSLAQHLEHSREPIKNQADWLLSDDWQLTDCWLVTHLWLTDTWLRSNWRLTCNWLILTTDWWLINERLMRVWWVTMYWWLMIDRWVTYWRLHGNWLMTDDWLLTENWLWLRLGWRWLWLIYDLLNDWWLTED